MLIVILFLIIVLIVALIWAVIATYKNPELGVLTFLFDWKYKTLWHIRRDYLNSLKSTPPTGYEFFKSRAMDYINNETNIKQPLLERQDIANMLTYEGYIYHYFVECGDFTVSVYRRMFTDYRSGDYATKDYPSQEKLRKLLPLEISTNEGAFTDFMKFVDAGWFDASTGMYIIGEKRISSDAEQVFESIPRNHQYIGRAIYRICTRNRIPSPEKVFGKLWDMPSKTIKEWLRTNTKETITQDIDSIVNSIITRK